MSANKKYTCYFDGEPITYTLNSLIKAYAKYRPSTKECKFISLEMGEHELRIIFLNSFRKVGFYSVNQDPIRFPETITKLIHILHTYKKNFCVK